VRPGVGDEIEEPDEIVDGDWDAKFTVEMMSARGDTWIWTDLAVDEAMDVYEMLGDPDVFRKLGDKPPKMPPGDDPRAGHPIKPLM
jgi:hypothetical protein